VLQAGRRTRVRQCLRRAVRAGVLLALLLRQRGRPRAPPLRQLSGSDVESGKAGGSAWAHTTASFTSAATTQCCKRALARGAGPDEHGSAHGSPVAPPAPRAQDRPDGARSREGTLLGEGTAVLQGLPRQACAGAAAPPPPPPHPPAPPLQRQSRPPSGQAHSRRSSMSASSTESAAGRPRAAARARGAAELPSWDAACDAAAAGCVQPGALQLQMPPRASAPGGALGPGPALAGLDAMAGSGGGGSVPAPAAAPPGRSPFAAAASSLTCSPPGSNRASPTEPCLRSAGGGAQAGGCGRELRRIASAGTAAALAAGAAAGAQRSLDSLGLAAGLLAPRAAASSLGAPLPRRCSIERAASAGDAEWAADGRMLALGTGDLNICFRDLKFIRSVGAGAPGRACPAPRRGACSPRRAPGSGRPNLTARCSHATAGPPPRLSACWAARQAASGASTWASGGRPRWPSSCWRTRRTCSWTAPASRTASLTTTTGARPPRAGRRTPSRSGARAEPTALPPWTLVLGGPQLSAAGLCPVELQSARPLGPHSALRCLHGHRQLWPIVQPFSRL